MKFGKLENIEQVDFSLPDDHVLTKTMLEHLEPIDKPNIYIGCPVWADKNFVGKVYPPKTKSTDFLRHYCGQFNAVELNATHYNIPALSTIKKWKETATPAFKFCPKWPQIISHRSNFQERNEIIDRFLATIYELEEHLGYSFIQFPPYFQPDRLADLYQFLEQLPDDFKIAIELRHEEWFKNMSLLGELAKVLTLFNVPLVITDVAGRRDVLHQLLTCDTVIVRFTGNGLHPTDYSRIDDWVEKLTGWVKQGVQTVYFFMHQPEEYLCADVVRYMIQELNKKSIFDLKAPDFIEQQGSLF